MRLLLILGAFFQVFVLRAQDTVLAFSNDLNTGATHILAIDMLSGQKKDMCEAEKYKYVYQHGSVYNAGDKKMYFIGDQGSHNTRQFVELDIRTGKITNTIAWQNPGYFNFCFHKGYNAVFAQEWISASPDQLRICWLDFSTKQWNELIKIPGQNRVFGGTIDHTGNKYLYAGIDYSGNAFLRIIDIKTRKVENTISFKHPVSTFKTYSINDFLYDENAQKAYFLNMAEEDTIEILSLDVETSQIKRLVSVPANYTYFTGSSVYSSKTNKIYFSTKVAADTRLFVYDINAGKLTESKLINNPWNYVLLSDLHIDDNTHLPNRASYKPLATNFNTFPNPSTGTVNLDGISGNSEVFVYTNTGRQIMHYTENPSQLNFSGLPAGQYFIRIVADGKAQTQTVIINP